MTRIKYSIKLYKNIKEHFTDSFVDFYFYLPIVWGILSLLYLFASNLKIKFVQTYDDHPEIKLMALQFALFEKYFLDCSLDIDRTQLCHDWYDYKYKDKLMKNLS